MYIYIGKADKKWNEIAKRVNSKINKQTKPLEIAAFRT